MPSEPVRTATVVATFWTNGYAFIRSDASGREYFLHSSDVIGEKPQKGDIVSFRVGEYNGRQKAFQVKIIKAATEGEVIS